MFTLTHQIKIYASLKKCKNRHLNRVPKKQKRHDSLDSAERRFTLMMDIHSFVSIAFHFRTRSSSWFTHNRRHYRPVTDRSSSIPKQKHGTHVKIQTIKKNTRRVISNQEAHLFGEINELSNTPTARVHSPPEHETVAMHNFYIISGH